MRNILVTGGAGYIGSIVTKKLIEVGYNVVVIDNFVRGHTEALHPMAKSYNCSTSDPYLVEILNDNNIELVMHFAAYAYVGESIENPLMYYENNVAGTTMLLKSMLICGIKRVIFSSTCSTFGIPEELPLIESTPQNPINPYGESKLMVERMLKALSISDGLQSVIFRYFNVAGSYGGLGENHEPETHLIPNVVNAALNDTELTIHGTDFETRDGTAIRDYVHVEDLANAHILGIGRFQGDIGGVWDYNLGTGVPSSVLDILKVVEMVTGKRVRYMTGPRRPGDPPTLYTCSDKAHEELGWRPKHDLESIIRSVLQKN